MPKVDGEADLSGNDVARVWRDREHAHRAAGIGRVIEGGAIHGGDHASGSDERVAPSAHGRRPGVGLLTGDRDLIPPYALDAFDDSDRFAFRLENGALLDMRLEECRHRSTADHRVPGISDTPQFFADCFALGIRA